MKVYGGQKIGAGQIIIRQRGSHWRAGSNVRRGGDDTLYAALDGTVQFIYRKRQRFTGKRVLIKEVRVTSDISTKD